MNFKNDEQVYKEVIKIRDITDLDRIMALCSGWSDEGNLKKIFENLVNTETLVNGHVAFNLKFLFQDIDNLTDFLKNTFSNIGYAKIHHKYFFVPMIERLKRDKTFALAIKNLLLFSTSISEKVSYYNLLSQANAIDEDVNSWKNKISDFKNDFGYDIVSNKIVRLKDVLHDYYY